MRDARIPCPHPSLFAMATATARLSSPCPARRDARPGSIRTGATIARTHLPRLTHTLPCPTAAGGLACSSPHLRPRPERGALIPGGRGRPSAGSARWARGRRPPTTGRAGHLAVLRVTTADAERTPAAATPSRPPPGHLRGCGADSSVHFWRPASVGSPPQVRSGPTAPRWPPEVMSGSPPRVRSRAQRRWRAQGQERVTAAGTERTDGAACGGSCLAGHLRRCGADMALMIWSWLIAGSPPQVRSRLLPREQGLVLRRVTSAGAERTRAARFRSAWTAGHLRRCGADCSSAVASHSSCGSPPQERSGLDLPGFGGPGLRVTSAGAERTSQLETRVVDRPGHLRRCGADHTLKTPSVVSSGSPPQVRSGRGPGLRQVDEDRVTSAGAERTICIRVSCQWPEGHLRRCGADLSTRKLRDPGTGSPPQVRSGQRLLPRPGRGGRVTSAGAERTLRHLGRWSGFAIPLSRFGG